jgi:hypothetical protein
MLAGEVIMKSLWNPLLAMFLIAEATSVKVSVLPEAALRLPPAAAESATATYWKMPWRTQDP